VSAVIESKFGRTTEKSAFSEICHQIFSTWARHFCTGVLASQKPVFQIDSMLNNPHGREQMIGKRRDSSGVARKSCSGWKITISSGYRSVSPRSGRNVKLCLRFFGSAGVTRSKSELLYQESRSRNGTNFPYGLLRMARRGSRRISS
jgi:hypothetical protein